MPITLNKAIIHELVKEQREAIQPSAIREHVLPPNNPSIIELIEGIVGLYGKKNSSAQYGVFKSGEGKGQFPESFENYHAAALTDESFKKLSLVGMDGLYIRAESELLASGGYILFADYESNGVRYFLSAMVKQKPGYKITGELEIEDLEYIDLSRLHQAARISFDKYKAYQKANDVDKLDINYLSFVNPSNNSKTAGYFVLAFGCEAGAPSAKATQAVVSESVVFFKREDTLKVYAEDIRAKLYDYLGSKQHNQDSAKLSEIEHIAREFFPADDADRLSEELVSHLNSDEVGVPNEFIVNKSKLHKMTHIVYKGDDLQLTFDKDDLGDDPDAKFYFDGTKLIITELPQDLKEMFTQHLNK